jgi:hypothetical protein
MQRRWFPRLPLFLVCCGQREAGFPPLSGSAEHGVVGPGSIGLPTPIERSYGLPVVKRRPLRREPSIYTLWMEYFQKLFFWWRYV